MVKIYHRPASVTEDGKPLNNKGYLLTEDNKYAHRIEYEKAFGKIPPYWVVHHVDFNKLNNTPENLIALPPRFHDKIHGMMYKSFSRFSKEHIAGMLVDYMEHAKALKEKLKDIDREMKKLNAKRIDALKAIHEVLGYTERITKLKSYSKGKKKNGGRWR